MSYQLVRQAIVEKRGIAAYYHGQYREMCPHVVGTKNGKLHALFYQYGGQSNSRPIQPDGSRDNWRCLDLSVLQDVKIINVDRWHTAPDHSRPQSCVDTIDLEVSY